MAGAIAQLMTPFRRITRPMTGPIGLDIGEQYIKAVQLRRGSNGEWILHAGAAFPRAKNAIPGAIDSADAARIGDVLFRRGFVGHDLVLAVPDEKLLTANLELPPRNDEIPFDQIARAEFARSLKVETEAFEFAYWDLPAPARAAKSTHVMGVGCRHADSEPTLAALEAAGFELRAMEAQACALTRACFPVAAAPNEITAIVDIGWGAVRLFVVHQAVVSYQRSLAGYGIERIFNAVAQQFSLDPKSPEDRAVIDRVTRSVHIGDSAVSGDGDATGETRAFVEAHFDAVAAEVVTSLSYTVHQYPDAAVRRVLLTGGAAAIAGLPGYLSSRLGTDALAIKASDIVRVDDASVANDPSFTLAIGLAQSDGEDA